VKLPAIEVDVWVVIFHSKLPQDLGSGAVIAAEFQTPTGGTDKASETFEDGAVASSRPAWNPQAPVDTATPAISAMTPTLRSIVQSLSAAGGRPITR
jgi:hypothetical protein